MFLLPMAFTASFSLILVLTKLIRRTESFMLIGGIFTAFSLLFGGVIYPAKLFPMFAKQLSLLTVPKHLLSGLERSGIKASVLPLVIISISCIALFIILEFVSNGALITKKRRAAA